MFINKRNKPFIFHGFQSLTTTPTSFKAINYELEQLFLFMENVLIKLFDSWFNFNHKDADTQIGLGSLNVNIKHYKVPFKYSFYKTLNYKVHIPNH